MQLKRINAHWFDGVFIFLTAIKSLGHDTCCGTYKCPCNFCSGGPMKAGLSAHGKALTLSSMFEAVGAFKEGSISKNFRYALVSCAGMFTANSMNCLMEVLGLAL